MGFKDVRALLGGFNQWSGGGNPVVSGDAPNP
jgi:hypothetical protein